MIWQPEFTDKTLSRKPGAVHREHGELLTAQLRLGPADILESDENGIIPEQDRVITQVVILDADKKQIQCVVRPLQILRADGTWENIGGMK
ncbi:phage tail fiber C-terminal domain-containing protein [Escherichia coli O157:H7]|uniref:phage tail fiber C-terminal domain-containing protein n=1 Tax=Escherichia coli TaxID=562 RepID=UPI0019D1AB6C|nr:phage tail fiber C-terminal domain-containing protein [Escherichia coli]QSK80990.1 phage tail fiber C-terminal domain-containing protein [Escherichia coli O157:H7]